MSISHDHDIALAVGIFPFQAVLARQENPCTGPVDIRTLQRCVIFPSDVDIRGFFRQMADIVEERSVQSFASIAKVDEKGNVPSLTLEYGFSARMTGIV